MNKIVNYAFTFETFNAETFSQPSATEHNALQNG